MPQKLIAAVLVERMAEVGVVSNDLIADPDVVRAVADALAQDERTAPYVLRVDSRHGIVTLRGEVPDEATRQAAVDTALGISLVSSVRNQLATGGAVQPAIALSRPSTKADEADPVSATTVRA